MSNTSKTKNALGKGLSALISENQEGSIQLAQADNNSTPPAAEQVRLGKFMKAKLIPVSQLVPGRFQPRNYFDEKQLKELARSIKENGVIQPILVRSEDTEGRYQIIAGERRWRASKQAGLKSIPAVVKELSDKEALEVALVENIQRQSLTPIEEAEGYERLLLEFKYTQSKIAANVGKSRSHIANTMRLLSLPSEVKDFINSGALTMGHARALIGAHDPVKLAIKIIDENLSVREAERFAAGSGQQGGGKKAHVETPSELKPGMLGYAPPAKVYDPTQDYDYDDEDEGKDEDLIALQKTLSEKMGLRVIIDYDDEGGQVSIMFNNMSDLDKILQLVG